MSKKVLFAAAMAWCAALLVTACSGGESAPATAKPQAVQAVEVRLGEYTLVSTVASAPSGSVTFSSKNNGLLEHELAVIKTDLAPDKLIVVGSQVDEPASGLTVGRIPTVEQQPGQVANVTLNLAAGQYVLICNIATHYQLGMRAGFTVR